VIAEKKKSVERIEKNKPAQEAERGEDYDRSKSNGSSKRANTSEEFLEKPVKPLQGQNENTKKKPGKAGSRRRDSGQLLTAAVRGEGDKTGGARKNRIGNPKVL